MVGKRSVVCLRFFVRFLLRLALLSTPGDLATSPGPGTLGWSRQKSLDEGQQTLRLVRQLAVAGSGRSPPESAESHPELLGAAFRRGLQTLAGVYWQHTMLQAPREPQRTNNVKLFGEKNGKSGRERADKNFSEWFQSSFKVNTDQF